VQKSAIFIHSLYAKIVWGENSYKDFEVCYYIFFLNMVVVLERSIKGGKNGTEKRILNLFCVGREWEVPKTSFSFLVWKKLKFFAGRFFPINSLI
jgi:hypothetical protein